MRELDCTWSSNASSGAQTAVEVHGDVLYTAFYIKASTGVDTATVTIQSAQSSGGPWFDEGGSTALTVGTQIVVRIAGPFGWVRPHINSTGNTIRAIGVS